jgi:hypothetical protein
MPKATKMPESLARLIADTLLKHPDAWETRDRGRGPYRTTGQLGSDRIENITIDGVVGGAQVNVSVNWFPAKESKAPEAKTNANLAKYVEREYAGLARKQEGRLTDMQKATYATLMAGLGVKEPRNPESVVEADVVPA